MTSALKNIQKNSNSYNLVNQYNSLTEGLSKYKYKNFIKNNEMNFIIQNDETYNFSELEDEDIIDISKFSLPFWFHTNSVNNTPNMGIQLDKTGLSNMNKVSFLSITDIPIILDTNNKIYQEFNTKLRKQTEYVVAVEYQIYKSVFAHNGQSIFPVSTKNLTIDLKVFNGTSYVTLNTDDFIVNMTDYKIVNSYNYTYQKLFIIKNLNKYKDNVKFKITLGGTIIDDELKIIIKSTNFYEGAVAINGITDKENFNDYIDFEDKIWKLSNDGLYYNPIFNPNLITVGNGGKYQNLMEAIDNEGQNVTFFLLSSSNISENKTLKRKCSIIGNGNTLIFSDNVQLNLSSENTIENLYFTGGSLVDIDSCDFVYLTNINFNSSTTNNGNQLTITDSTNIQINNCRFNNNLYKSLNCIKLTNSYNCNITASEILEYGYVNGSIMNGSGVYLSNSKNNIITINKISTTISRRMDTYNLYAVEQDNTSTNNKITILNHIVTNNGVEIPH